MKQLNSRLQVVDKGKPRLSGCPFAAITELLRLGFAVDLIAATKSFKGGVVMTPPLSHILPGSWDAKAGSSTRNFVLFAFLYIPMILSTGHKFAPQA
jgi:hypothetical protein